MGSSVSKNLLLELAGWVFEGPFSQDSIIGNKLRVDLVIGFLKDM